MDLDNFHDLLTPMGQNALAAAMALQPREKDFLPHFQNLSKVYPLDIARGALEIAILRGEATSKFPQADQLYFTREALQQASYHEISTHRAERYRGYTQIADLGCSIGGDTKTLAGVAPTIGIDRDSLRLAMARENLKTLDLDADFIQADLVSSFPCLQYPSVALFFDPAKRENGRSISSVKKYIPPLPTIANWLSYYPALSVKISPAVEMKELFGYDAEVEFISLNGQLKETMLWFGPLKSGQRRATVLPGPHMMIDDVTTLDLSRRPTLAISQPLRYFYEPDPAVIRAGMVQALMVRLGAAQINQEIAYLTADKKISTPFARVWEVEGWFPFQLKKLRAYLRERNVSSVTVKKQGSPILPEDLIHALHLSEETVAGKQAGEERVLFLTRLRDYAIVVVCYPEETG
jgi:hypothetical protein